MVELQDDSSWLTASWFRSTVDESYPKPSSGAPTFLDPPDNPPAPAYNPFIENAQEPQPGLDAMQDLLYGAAGLSDSTGTKAMDADDTDAYGNTLVFCNSPLSNVGVAGVDPKVHHSACPYIFTGQGYDGETGLHYSKNRRDPLGSVFGAGLFGDLSDNPFAVFDQTGQFSDPTNVNNEKTAFLIYTGVDAKTGAFTQGAQPPVLGNRRNDPTTPRPVFPSKTKGRLIRVVPIPQPTPPPRAIRLTQFAEPEYPPGTRFYYQEQQIAQGNFRFPHFPLMNINNELYRFNYRADYPGGWYTERGYIAYFDPRLGPIMRWEPAIVPGLRPPIITGYAYGARTQTQFGGGVNVGAGFFGGWNSPPQRFRLPFGIIDLGPYPSQPGPPRSNTR